jgi:hypothetical protein
MKSDNRKKERKVREKKVIVAKWDQSVKHYNGSIYNNGSICVNNSDSSDPSQLSSNLVCKPLNLSSHWILPH